MELHLIRITLWLCQRDVGVVKMEQRERQGEDKRRDRVRSVTHKAGYKDERTLWWKVRLR